MCLLFNFYKENAVREWSFKRAITIQTYNGYDPIPVPLNIIYRIYRLLRLCTEKVKKEEDVSGPTQSHFFGKNATVFVCLFYYVTIIIIFWFCLVGFVLSALNYAKEVSIIFCFRMNFWDLYRTLKENTSGIMRIRFQLQVS